MIGKISGRQHGILRTEATGVSRGAQVLWQLHSPIRTAITHKFSPGASILVLLSSRNILGFQREVNLDS